MDELSIIAISTLRNGLLIAPLAMGIAVAFRLLRYPDLTADGSLIMGSATTVLALNGDLGWGGALLAGTLAGGTAGLVTATLSEGLGLDRILAGIATTLICYTAFLRVVGGGNRPLALDTITVYEIGMPDIAVSIIVTVFLGFVVVALVSSSWGLWLRAVGENPKLVFRLGRKVRPRVIGGVVFANAIIGFGSSLATQHDRFIDVTQGAGSVFVGLACVLVGSLVPGQARPWVAIVSAAVGALMYSLIIATALRMGLFPSDLRALTALLVVCAAVLANRLTRDSERIPLFG